MMTYIFRKMGSAKARKYRIVSKWDWDVNI